MDQVIVVDGSRPFSIDTIPTRIASDLDEGTASARLAGRQAELRQLQELMFASEANGVLVVLQGMDAAGKDVIIQNVFATATAEAIRVEHLTAMTDEEEAHDFLWRAHAVCPARGELVIFDRSHYEQVINPMVHDDAPKELIAERCEDIVAFERLLQRGAIVIVKVLLHVGFEEQERRLHEREASEETAWKISRNDWIGRRLWPRYMAAFERVVNGTATRESPWHVVPADDQALLNLAVADLLVAKLEAHRERWTEERRRVGEEKRDEAREARKEMNESAS